MGGRKIVYVRIVVAAIFDFMLPLTRPTSFSLLEFQHCAFANKNIRAPEDYITLRLNDFFFFWGGGGRGGVRGCVHIMMVRSSRRATACYFQDMLLFLGFFFL